MISVEHYKNDEILFQNVFRHRESINLRVRGMLITYCFCDFLFYGYPCTTNENMMLSCRKNYGVQFTDKGYINLRGAIRKFAEKCY